MTVFVGLSKSCLDCGREWLDFGAFRFDPACAFCGSLSVVSQPENDMRTRFTINEKGQLADRDGNVLGRLTSLTLEHDAVSRGGTTGGGFEFSEQNTENTPPTPPSDVDRVWARYVELFDAGRQTLNSTRRT